MIKNKKIVDFKNILNVYANCHLKRANSLHSFKSKVKF